MAAIREREMADPEEAMRMAVLNRLVLIDLVARLSRQMANAQPTTTSRLTASTTTSRSSGQSALFQIRMRSLSSKLQRAFPQRRLDALQERLSRRLSNQVRTISMAQLITTGRIQS